MPNSAEVIFNTNFYLSSAIMTFHHPEPLRVKGLRAHFFKAVSYLSVTILLIALSGCGNEGEDQIKRSLDAGKPVKGGELIFQIAEPAYIDPYNVQETEGAQVAANIFDGLVSFDPITSRIVPAVANDWIANEKNTIWTFNLKHNTKFHNGREVVAEDFVYAFNRIADPSHKDPSVISYHLSAIKGYDDVQSGKADTLSGLRAKDPYTLEIELSYPYAAFIYNLGHQALVPVPKEEVEKDPDAFAQMPVGNGPFMMAEPWKHDESIKVKRFNDHYGKVPYLDKVTFKIYRDEQTAYLDFEAGNLNFLSLIPTGQVTTASKKYGSADYLAKEGAGVLFGEEASLYYLSINNDKPALDDVRVRKAISYAIDRNRIADSILEGAKWPASSIIPPGTIGFNEEANYLKTDRNKSKELLKEAGYPEGQGLPKIEMTFNSGSGHEEIMQAVQSDLKEVGIDVELKGMDFGSLLDVLAEGDHQIAREAWFLDYPTPDNILYSLFHSSNIGGSNSSQYSDPEVDSALLEARERPNLDQAIEAYKLVEQMVFDDMPIVPLFFYRHSAIVDPSVNAFVFSPLGIVPLEDAWITADIKE